MPSATMKSCSSSRRREVVLVVGALHPDVGLGGVADPHGWTDHQSSGGVGKRQLSASILRASRQTVAGRAARPSARPKKRCGPNGASRVLLKCLVPQGADGRAAGHRRRGAVAARSATPTRPFWPSGCSRRGSSCASTLVVSDDPRRHPAPPWSRLRAEVDVVVATGGPGPDRGRPDRRRRVRPPGYRARRPTQPSLEAMKKRFATHGFEMTPNNLRQVRVPAGPRRCRTAPASRPGFASAWAAPRPTFCPACRARWSGCSRTRWCRASAAAWRRWAAPPPAVRTWHVYGMGESHIDHRLAGLLTGVEGATLALPHVAPGTTSRWSCAAPRSREAQATLERIDAELRKRIGAGHLWRRRRKLPAAWPGDARPGGTLALAESCTGGWRASSSRPSPAPADFFRGSSPPTTTR